MESPEIIIVPVVFLTFFLITKTLSDNRLKRILIERGKVDDNLKMLDLSDKTNPLTSVKWGLVLIGIGLALIIGQVFDFRNSEEVTFGLASLFAGAGFLIYYRMANKEENRQSE